ncbi:hypothetical protein VTN31DRAFT_6655 [Thermomyces dupontii]|uniref:uncharacterized protein n=1 Tax=Talaromyces thermophilus TaxID=28565 RepID=UPI003743F2F8
MNPRTAGIIIVKPIAANPNAQKGATQPPRSIHCDAKEYLNNVAMCLRTAKMFEVEKNRRWRCRDPSQVDVVRPFLEKLGLYNENFVNMSRCAGRTKIIKAYGLNNFFFPLSRSATVGGHHLEPGMYIFLSSEEELDGNWTFWWFRCRSHFRKSHDSVHIQSQKRCIQWSNPW